MTWNMDVIIVMEVLNADTTMGHRKPIHSLHSNALLDTIYSSRADVCVCVYETKWCVWVFGSQKRAGRQAGISRMRSSQEYFGISKCDGKSISSSFDERGQMECAKATATANTSLNS